MADSPRIEELKRRVQSDPASIAFAALAEEYRRAGRFEEAIAACRTGLQRHPSYISAHVTLGRALLEVGDFDAARQELELVLRVAPENLAAIRGLAEIHHRTGQRAHAAAFSASHFEEMTAPRAPEPPAHEPSATEPPAPDPADAPPQPPRIQLRPPAPHAEAPAPAEETVSPRVDRAAIPVASQSSVAVSAPPADPAPAPLDEIEPPRVDLARIPVATPSSVALSAPPADPALAPLEAFLEAILRARESAQGVPLS